MAMRCSVTRWIVGLTIMTLAVGAVGSWEVLADDKIYWTDRGTDNIRRANLDGSNVEGLPPFAQARPEGIALDVAGGKMYWHNIDIFRANLDDGSNLETLVTGFSGIRGNIALDLVRGKMYWGDSEKIRRANLDGSDVEDVVGTNINPAKNSGIALLIDTPPVAADTDGDGVDDAIDICPNTAIPEAVPTLRLGVNRFALIDGDTAFDTTSPKGNGPQASFTLADTAGCSCEQIIEALELGKGHTKFGCSISGMEDFIAQVQPEPFCAIFPGDGVDGPALSYQDNSDGTITDLNTGLMWEKKVSGGTRTCDLGSDLHAVDTRCRFADATGVWIDTVNAENSGAGYAGFNDWRISNVRELMSIVDYGRSSPGAAINPIFGPTDASDYLSSTRFAGNPNSVWFVIFTSGDVLLFDKSVASHVRAVRGGR